MEDKCVQVKRCTQKKKNHQDYVKHSNFKPLESQAPYFVLYGLRQEKQTFISIRKI